LSVGGISTLTGDVNIGNDISIESSTGTINAKNIISSSDITLKTNMVTIHNGLDTLQKITPITWNWKDDIDGPKQSGIMAQNVAEHIPHAVRTVLTTGKLAVDYNSLIGYLISAVRELGNQVDTLSSQVNK